MPSMRKILTSNLRYCLAKKNASVPRTSSRSLPKPSAASARWTITSTMQTGSRGNIAPVVPSSPTSRHSASTGTMITHRSSPSILAIPTRKWAIMKLQAKPTRRHSRFRQRKKAFPCSRNSTEASATCAPSNISWQATELPIRPLRKYRLKSLRRSKAPLKRHEATTPI